MARNTIQRPLPQSTSTDEGLVRVHQRLEGLSRGGFWPAGPRHLWTDAFGVVLLLSLFGESGDEERLDEARQLVGQVDRVLGRRRGIRSGERRDRDSQSFQHLSLWVHALERLGRIDPKYQERAVNLVREIHSSFVRPRVGVYSTMKEDLSGPYPGTGFGALEPYLGFVIYRLLAPKELAAEIAELRDLIQGAAAAQGLEEDLALGLILWLTHFFPKEDWALECRSRALATLETMWIDPPGYYCRWPGLRHVRSAVGNYCVSLGLQAAGEDGSHTRSIHRFFGASSGSPSDATDPLTQIMACVSDLPGEFLRHPPVPTVPADDPEDPSPKHT